MKIIDVTKPLTPNTPVYPGDPDIVLEEIVSHDKCLSVITSKIQMGSHSGTHIDAPAHIDPNLEPLPKFPLEWAQGRATVIETQSLDESFFKFTTQSSHITFLIIKSSKETPKFPLIDSQLASKLKSSGVHVIGTDQLSVDNDSSILENHQTLLREGIWVIENLDLSKISKGQYGYTMAPLKVSVRDGAPVRGFLTDQYRNWDSKPREIHSKSVSIKNRMAEAEEFVKRAGLNSYDPFKLNIIANLWLAADESDDQILECLHILNETITNNVGLISVERGSTPQSKDHLNTWDFHCEWRLSWNSKVGVTVTLTTPDQDYQPQFQIAGTSSNYRKILLDINDRNALEISLINCVLVETYQRDQ